MQFAKQEIGDLERIRYVTENYERLQGLREVAVGVVMVLLGSSGMWGSFMVGFGLPFALVLGVGLLSMVLLPAWAGLYYRRRFGRVRSRWRGLSRYEVTGMLLTLAFVWSLLAAFQFLGREMERFLPGAAWGLYVGGLILYTWWPKRSRLTVHWPVLAVLVAGAGPVLSLAVQVPGWQLILPMISVFGIASIIGGFLDHLLLVRTIKAPPEGDDDQAV